MNILLGLGNPGEKYVLTRHNAGFLFLDHVAKKLNIPFRAGRGDYFFAEGKLAEKEIFLIRPTTYMNNSGVVLAQFEPHLSETLNNIIVIYDDFHLPFGTIRFRPKGTDAGHNGIKSIIYHLGSDVFPRLKIGIGSEFDDKVNFVLSDFSENEISDLSVIFDYAYKGLICWIENGISSAMNGFNRNLQI